MTKTTHTLATSALLGVLLLAGCGGNDQTTANDQPPESDMSTSPSAPGSESPQARSAVVDLASRLEVDESEVAVVEVEAVTWRDGSLGCAEPGTMYTQALVEGHRITLTVGEERYEYHDGGRRDPFLCEDPTQ